jgi:predicted DNA-binding transcriptional regulator AlpA
MPDTTPHGIPDPTPTSAAQTQPEPGRPAARVPTVEPLLLNADQAASLCGVSSATWYRMASSGRCPAPLRLSAGCVRWRVEELRDWIEAGCPPRREWEARRAAAKAGGHHCQAGGGRP